jgi:hypothetical protein
MSAQISCAIANHALLAQVGTRQCQIESRTMPARGADRFEGGGTLRFTEPLIGMIIGRAPSHARGGQVQAHEYSHRELAVKIFLEAVLAI